LTRIDPDLCHQAGSS